MLTQDFNSLPGFRLETRCYTDESFPTVHIHRSAELILVQRGAAAVTIGDRTVSVRAGAAVLALPFCPHAFDAPGARLLVCVFARECVPDFYDRLGGRRSTVPVFVPDSAAMRYFCAQFDGAAAAHPPGTHAMCPARGSELAQSSALYGVLASFLALASFDAEPGLYERVLDYISAHAAEPLTLASIADAFGYEKHYMSRLLRRSTRLNLRTLINLCRVERAKQLLDESCSATAAAMESGFGTLRSFDRAFRAATGVCPRDWARRDERKQTGGIPDGTN